MSFAVFAPIATGVMVAGFVQGTTGVGFALIVAPILALLAPDLVPVSLLMLMIPLNVYVAWREWGALDRSGATWITIGRFIGTFGGLWLLTALTSSFLNTLIGAITILAAVATLIAPSLQTGPREPCCGRSHHRGHRDGDRDRRSAACFGLSASRRSQAARHTRILLSSRPIDVARHSGCGRARERVAFRNGAHARARTSHRSSGKSPDS